MSNSSHDTNVEHDAFLTKIFGEYEFNRFGIISMLLIFVVCIGGVAVAVGGLTSALQIGLLIVPTLATLSFILAVGPMRLILYTGITASTISTIIILLHLTNVL